MACGGVRKLEVFMGSSGYHSISSNKQALDVAHQGQRCDEVYLLSKYPPSTWRWRTARGITANREPINSAELWQESELADGWAPQEE